jgi:hypothetical protein
VAPAGDRTEVGVVEGLEPGSLVTSEELRAISSSAPPTETQTSLSPDIDTDTAGAVFDHDGPTTRRAAPPPPPTTAAPTSTARAEPTVIVRHGAPTLEPVSATSRRPLAIAAVLGVVTLAVVAFMAWPRTATPVTGLADAGPRVAVIEAPALPDAGVAVVDAGQVVIDDVVDAGAVDIAAVADAGVGDEPDAGPTTPRTPRPKPPPKRQLPPWPGVLREKTAYLSKHCGHLACARALYGDALKAKLVASGRDAVEAEADKCFQRCR